MKKWLLLITITAFVSCKPGKKDDAGNNVKTDSATIGPAKTDTGIAVQTDPGITTGKVDMESFGPLKLGQHNSKTLDAMGQPDSKSKPIEWGADGLLHEDWAWKKNGLVLNMSSDKANIDSTLSVFSITATAPCDFKTKAGLGIGSTYAEVEAAYKKDIDPEATDKTQITVGSVYGGIIFSFKNDKVNKIFLGAEAE